MAKVPVILDEDEDVRIKIHNLLQYTSDRIYFKDLNSVFTLTSQSVNTHYGLGPDESMVGKSDHDFYDKECAERFRHREQEIMRTGEPILEQTDTETSNGEQTWVFSSKLPLFDEDGKIVGIFGISRDITQQKLTELKLQETNQLLVETSRRAGMAEIAVNVIHNVGNVLNSVKVAVFKSDEICGKTQFEKIERVAELIEQHSNDECFFQEGHKGSHIPGYLRSLAASFRSEQDEVRKELADTQRHLEHICSILAQQQQHVVGSKIIETVDLSSLISDAILMSSSSLKAHNIELVCDFEEGLVAQTDKHSVLQIVVNLIRNAKHACLDSGIFPRLIKVSLENALDESFSISISDSGIGIANENIVKIFSHGFTTREQGNGFGLHSGANAARELGGSLTASSEGPNMGATFVLKLPGTLK